MAPLPGMEVSRRWLPLAAAAAGAGAASASLAFDSGCRCTGYPPGDQFAAVGTGLLFVLAGLIAWLRPGGARVGQLMSAVGITWYARTLWWVPNPLAFTAAQLTSDFCAVLLGHLAVAFPSGRLQSRLDRVVIALSYALYLPMRSSVPLFWDPAPRFPTHRNLLLLWPSRSLASAADAVYTTYAVVMTMVILALVLRHWHQATRFGRRALAPVLLACVPAAAAIVVLNLVGLSHSTVPLLMALGLIAMGFLAGVLRTGFDHAAVSRLVIDLGEAPARGYLQDALARTLHDPSLTLAYWLPERAGYVDAHGRTLELPGPGAERTAAVLQSGGAPYAALVHDAGLEHDRGLLEATVAAARLAIENERLQADIRNQIQEVTASRARILAAADAERRRIEHDLREGLDQRLTGLSRSLTAARAALGPGDETGLDHALAAAADDAEAALNDLQELARGVHPAILCRAGLGPALRSLASRCPVPVTVSAAPAGRFRAAVEAAAYFVVAEALTNVAKHARASRVTLRAERVDGRLVVTAADDGIGGASVGASSGLRGMADRAAALDGRLEVVSPAGGGTLVRFEIPIDPVDGRGD